MERTTFLRPVELPSEVGEETSRWPPLARVAVLGAGALIAWAVLGSAAMLVGAIL